MVVDGMRARGRSDHVYGDQHVRKHVSERDLNPYVCGLRCCSPGPHRETDNRRAKLHVSEAQGLPIAHARDIALTRTFALGGVR